MGERVSKNPMDLYGGEGLDKSNECVWGFIISSPHNLLFGIALI